jgi:hypothetical protein
MFDPASPVLMFHLLYRMWLRSLQSLDLSASGPLGSYLVADRSSDHHNQRP